jgi:hypothetical protein
MPEIIPINSTVHFKAAFDIKGHDVAKPMTQLRQKVRRWCIEKVASSDPILHRGWFYVGNNPKVEPAQYYVNEHQLRTVSAPSKDPEEPTCWAFEMIHPDWDERPRHWSVEIALRKNEDSSVRFTTVVRNWMTANYIGEYPAPPSPSAPSYVRTIVDDPALFCTRGDARLASQPIVVINSTTQQVYDALVSDQRQVPIVFMAYHNPSNGVLIPAHRVANALIGNANVYVLSSEAVVDEMNYYLGDELRCSPGTIRVYFPQVDKGDATDSRRHRYLSASFVTQYGEEAILRFLTNGLSRNGSTFRLADLISFTDIFSERRKYAIKKLAAEKEGKSEEASLVWQDNEKLSTELSSWESTAIQYESENCELKKELAGLKYRVEEAERVRHQIDDLESQLKGIGTLASLPQSLSDILKRVAALFPNRIEIADNAFSTAEAYSNEQLYWGNSEGLNVAWEMVFGVATRLYELVFKADSSRLEEEFGESFSRFELALSEGKQTKKDAKLMALRRLEHHGDEFDITPHVKFGNRKPKMLRLHFAIKRESKKLIVGHFGDHLDNYTTKAR